MLPILLLTIEDQEDKLIFENLYDKYKDATMRRALKLLNDHQFDAEDAFQRAWSQISMNIDKIKCREEAAIATYIMKTIEFKAIDIANKNKKYRKCFDSTNRTPQEVVSDELVYLVCGRVQCETIVKVLQAMDDKYKDIMMLTYLYGFDVKTIAEQLNMKEKTVWTRLYRGKALLIEELKKRGVTDE